MLENLLVSQLFAFLMVFSRLGSMMMLMPGVGESYVSPRIRLLLALAVSLVMTPLAEKVMPPVPGSPLTLTILLAAEITVGVFLGMVCRIMLSAMHTAGLIIAMQSGLASAMMFDPMSGSQGSLFGNLLGMATVIILFSFDLHHVMIMGVADSYSLFVPGHFPPTDDLARFTGQMVASTFAVAIAFTTPHLVIGLLVNLGAGLISRVMPAMQIFFIIMPVQIAATIFLLMVTVSSGMIMYMNHVEDALNSFLLPR